MASLCPRGVEEGPVSLRKWLRFAESPERNARAESYDAIGDGRGGDYHLPAAARAEMLSDAGEGTAARAFRP